ncbi:site-specific integrase [Larkinella punicea]|nr:site-specific integrase [Larkinella punicea]
MNINLFLRSPNGDKPTPIYIDIRYANNKLRLVYPTNEKIEPEFWDKENQRPARRGKYKNQPEFATRLHNAVDSVKEILRRYLNDNDQQPPTIEDLRRLLNLEFKREAVVEVKPLDLFGFMEAYMEESIRRINEKTGHTISKTTLSGYKSSVKKLREFTVAVRKYRNLNFDDITLEFYADFTDWLNAQGYAKNSVGKHIKTLKLFLSEATERGLNKNLTFKSRRFIKPREDTDAPYLTEVEISRLFHLNIPYNPRLERVRDLMIVGCWTGLRFQDFTQIRPQDFGEDADGKYIQIETRKTGETVVIPVHPMVEAIRKRYEGKTPNGLPKALSNQKMNNYLKELGRLAHIDEMVSITRTEGGKRITRTNPKHELLSTHAARRSFATNQYLAGIPAYDIMRITGHRTEKVFFNYIKMRPREAANKIRKIWQQNAAMQKVG